MKKQGTHICFPLKVFYFSFGTIKIRKKIAYKDHQLVCCNQIRLKPNLKKNKNKKTRMKLLPTPKVWFPNWQFSAISMVWKQKQEKQMKNTGQTIL